jgi:hypothetical protein
MSEQEKREKDIEMALSPILEECGISRLVSRGITMGWAAKQGAIIAAIREYKERIKKLEIVYKQAVSEKEKVIQLSIDFNNSIDSTLKSLTEELPKLILEKISSNEVRE